MIYIFLEIICSSSIALLFKYSEIKKLNRYMVTVVNYFIASFVAIILARKIICSIFLGENYLIFDNFNNGKMIFEEAIAFSTVLGIITGFIYCISFILYQISVKKSGAGLSSAFGKLGIIVPMGLSIILWNEVPSWYRIVGIIIALFSIVFLYLDKDERNKSKTSKILIIFSIICGLGEFNNKIFQKYVSINYKEFYLMILFITAFIISIIIAKRNNSLALSRKNLLVGTLIGIPNILNSFFLILALEKANTSIVFSTFSAGTIVLVNFISMLVFKEKKTKRTLFILCGIIFSVILINI